MAVNGYLYIDGIQGPSTSRTDHIDILSFTWGVSQNAVYGAGASGKEAKAGRADFQNLVVTKVLDSTSPALFALCSAGAVLEKAYILYDKPVGDKQSDYFRIWMKDALIVNQSIGAAQENANETVSFAFQAVEVAYKPEKDDGTLDGALSKGYNLASLKTDFAATDTF